MHDFLGKSIFELLSSLLYILFVPRELEDKIYSPRRLASRWLYINFSMLVARVLSRRFLGQYIFEMGHSSKDQDCQTRLDESVSGID